MAWQPRHTPQREAQREVNRPSRAFSLIELLVVIAIVAVLVAILLPGMARCKFLSRQARELSAGRQLLLATSLYSDDYRGQILPGYAPSAWVNGPMVVADQEGERITGDEAQRYPWRLAPYLNYDFRGLYQDNKTLIDIKARAPEYEPLGVDYRYVVSLFPSLGMNAAFVGGSDRLGQFNPSWEASFGDVIVDRFDEASRPSQVMAYVSARAERQPLLPTLGRPEGYFRVDPPFLGPDANPRWQPSYDANATYPGVNSGFVAMRRGERAVAAMLDGHAETLNWEQLRDMRRWCDRADRADWVLVRRN